MACTTGCATKDHKTMGECLRAKGVRTTYVNHLMGFDRDSAKKWDNDLAAYRDARRQGIQPASCDRAATDAAVQASDRMGVAYRA